MSARRALATRACRSGFTYIEVVVCLAILGLTILPLFLTTSMANRGTMDAYYEFLAGSLAQEPIEVFRSHGYRWLAGYQEHPLEEFPLAWQDLASSDWQKYPAEVGVFKRLIELSPCPAVGEGPKAVRVRVSVAPREASWLSRNQVVVEALVVEEPE